MKKRVYISDFETSTGNVDGSTNVYLWGIMSVDKTERYAGVNLTEFFNTVFYYDINLVYFHNMSWDCSFILHHIIEQGYTWESEMFKKPKGEKAFTWMKDGLLGNLYSLIVRKGDKVIEFRDTAKLLQGSVDDMGKILGLPKLEIDYDKYKHFNKLSEVPYKLKDYLWRDIEIVIDFFVQFKKDFGAHGITMGATAVKSYIKHIGLPQYRNWFGGWYYDKKEQIRKYKNIITKEYWDIHKEGYRGGLVVFRDEWRHKEIECKNGTSADINSLYPAMYGGNRMPVGSPQDVRPYGPSIAFRHIFIKKAVIRDPELPAIIPNKDSVVKKEVKYNRVVEHEYHFIWENELEVWEKYYDMDYRIVQSWYHSTEWTFKTWVDEQKHLKENAPNAISRRNAKLNINAFYGKLGQAYKRSNRVLVKDPFNVMTGTRYADEWVEQKEINESDNLTPIFVASYITSLARSFLAESIYVNKDIFIYADTDSMYCIDTPRDIEIHDSKFGAWKWELQFSKFKFIKPKCYLAQLTAEYDNGKWVKTNKLKRAIAGMSKETHKQVLFENFNKGNKFLEGKTQKKNVKGGVILVGVKYTL